MCSVVTTFIMKHMKLHHQSQSGFLFKTLGVMHSWTGVDLFVLSDLDWSWFEPEVLVTSSVDTYIYIWDTR